MMVVRASRPGSLIAARTGLVLAATVVALVVAELVLRQFPPPTIELQYLDAGRQPMTLAVAEILDPAITPRPQVVSRTMAPGVRIYLRYKGLRRPWLEEDGAVQVRINQAGIRDREEIGFAKPPGQRRILCLGDSVTVGWGIPVEDCWVRRIEAGLRRRFGDVRTVNCGFMGTKVVDEYWYGIKHRFHRFQPDMVVVTLCLNDLLICNAGVAHFRPAAATSSLELLNRLRTWLGKKPHQLDPDVDYLEQLLNLPADHAMYKQQGLTRDMLWASGTPQRALREMKAWCGDRDLPMVIILWPFLQGLEADERYPFQKMHDMVAAFCASTAIPFLDLLPALRGHRSTDLWVAPIDMHGNPKAQALVSGPIMRFLSEHCGFEHR
jgi:hypothetical protein